jgi:hypothetical protein
MIVVRQTHPPNGYLADTGEHASLYAAASASLKFLAATPSQRETIQFSSGVAPHDRRWRLLLCLHPRICAKRCAFVARVRSHATSRGTLRRSIEVRLCASLAYLLRVRSMKIRLRSWRHSADTTANTHRSKVIHRRIYDLNFPIARCRTKIAGQRGNFESRLKGLIGKTNFCAATARRKYTASRGG